VQVNTRVCRQEFINALGLMSREVVGDDVDLFPRGLVRNDVGEERDELGRSVTRCGFAQYFTSLGH
jgi:hypothetical protein